MNRSVPTPVSPLVTPRVTGLKFTFVGTIFLTGGGLDGVLPAVPAVELLVLAPDNPDPPPDPPEPEPDKLS